jgi:hypothetical protein
MNVSAGRKMLGVLLLLAVAAVGAASRQTADGWQAFEGSWNAAGEQELLAVGDGRSAATIRLSGALAITGNTGLRRGFRAQAIGFDDGRGAGVGRALWTDDRGDQIFSEIVGQPARSGRRIEGTITGGTGRYAGLTGSYSFEWRYLLPADETTLQAQSVTLIGRYRLPTRQ